MHTIHIDNTTTREQGISYLQLIVQTTERPIPFVPSMFSCFVKQSSLRYLIYREPGKREGIIGKKKLKNLQAVVAIQNKSHVTTGKQAYQASG